MSNVQHDRPASILTDAVRDRGRGALLGLAVGDALGATLEFQTRDSRPLHTEMIGGGPFGLAPGQWTDDTAMALALADSLIACGGLDGCDLMGRFLSWWREGSYSSTGSCFDIGITTRQALSRFERTGDPFAGSTSPRTAGNGSLMRLAPAALFALQNAALADRIARDQSRTTHGAPEAVDACGYFVELLRTAILGNGDVLSLTDAPREHIQLVSDQASIAQPYRDLAPSVWKGEPAIVAIARGTWREKSRAKIRSTGYVVDTLEAALWAAGSTASFEEALVLAVNLAGDADTVGAVTGQLAGAMYGASAIPARWLEPLAWRERIVTTSDKLTDRMRDVRSM